MYQRKQYAYVILFAFGAFSGARIIAIDPITIFDWRQDSKIVVVTNIPKISEANLKKALQQKQPTFQNVIIKRHSAYNPSVFNEKIQGVPIAMVRPQKPILQLKSTNPLHEVADKLERGTEKDMSAIEVLLWCGANINQKDPDEQGNTLLHRAATHGTVDQIIKLLHAGAAIDAVNDALETPLHCATARDHLRTTDAPYAGAYLDIVQALLNGQANPNVQDVNGYTPLRNAVDNGRTLIIDALLKAGAYPHISDDFGATPLHIAAAMSRGDFIIPLLIDATTPTDRATFIDLQDNSGDTALHIAAARGFFESVKILVSAGANKNLRNDYNRRPIDETKNQQIFRFLNK